MPVITIRIQAVRRAVDVPADGPGKRHHQSAPGAVGERTQLRASGEISGFLIPSLNKREARTTVELRDGQSFAIAGLLQAETGATSQQLPWIGSVPVLGALFRSKSYQEEETDLVVIVTPHLVAPGVPGQQLATPLDNPIPTNDVDFFLMGQMEQRKVFGITSPAAAVSRAPTGT